MRHRSEKLDAGVFIAILILLAAGLLLAPLWAFSQPDPRQEVSRRKERFVLVGIDPPNHFSVDLRDAQGNAHHFYVSKYCDTWRSLVVGQEIKLDVMTYRRPRYNGGATYESIDASYDAICPKA